MATSTRRDLLSHTSPRSYGSGSAGRTPRISNKSSTLLDGSPIEFVELLGRSNFSFLQGASHPEDLVLQARALAYQGLALCDLNGLYGVVKAYQALEHPSAFLAHQWPSYNKKFGYIVGSELTLNDKSHLALIPMNKHGYQQLCRLITKAKVQAPKTYSSLQIEDVLQDCSDLLVIALPPWNRDRLVQLHCHLGNRLYLPVWRDYSWESWQYCQQAFKLEQELGLQLFVTNRPMMARPEEKPLHDVMTCILHQITLKSAKTRLLPNSERYLKPLYELTLIWKDRPDLLKKTALIASRVQFSLKELRYEYPQAHLPPGHSPQSFLQKKVKEGIQWRYPEGASKKVQALVKKELALINDLEYEDYFLTLLDICDFARQRNILFQGRGSAANSVVCYVLGLTAVDPNRFDLLFERFISKERGEPPDIDIDFENSRREEIIQYIYQKYGTEHAAMVATVICYRSRMALREVSKVLGIPAGAVDKMVKFMGREGIRRLIENPERVSDFGISPQSFKHLIELCRQLQGTPRHLGIHTGGFLVTRGPVTESVPIEKAAMADRYVIQWNKDDLSLLKMMKIDVLGLGMLTALRKSFDLLKEHKKLPLCLASIPSDDKKTYNMIQQADTVGVFQIESRAQMSLLPRLKPKCFYDLVIEVAIVRPGPIQGGMVHPFLKRRDGLEKVTYAHPRLEAILKKTLGVPIFQEQLMQMASSVCGFSPGEADELRRLMSSSWNKQDIMKGLKQRIINGMLNNGIQLKYAEQIYQTIEGFSSYGFPESHSASFALLTYASSYIKAHHPEVFVCALLNSQPMGFYSPRALVADARRHQVRFLPLDIQYSDYNYKLEKQSDGRFQVRLGLRAIYGIKQTTADKITTLRSQLGRFESLAAFIQSCDLKKPELLKLAASGALRSFGISPRKALWLIQSLNLDPNSLVYGWPNECFDKTSIFGATNDNESIQLPTESSWDAMQREYKSYGFSPESHPLELLRPKLKSFKTSEDLKKLCHGSLVQVAGLMSILQRPPTAKGFCFLTLEDEKGSINVVMTPQVYQKYRMEMTRSPFLKFEGRLERQKGVVNVKAHKARILDEKYFLF